jgi:cell division protease FtsH
MKKSPFFPLTSVLKFGGVVIAVIGLLIVVGLAIAKVGVTEISYSDFFAKLKDGNFGQVSVSEGYLYGTPKVPTPAQPTEYVARRVDPTMAAELQKYSVPFSGKTESTVFSDLFLWIAPAVFFALVWFGMSRMMGGNQGLNGMMTIGKSKAKVYVENDTKVTFSDVAGVDEAKAELLEIVQFLKDPERYGRLGARIPKGILLVGPPGTGKTLLARAVAGEAGVPFFSISGSEFVEMFVGVGAARVRDLFDQARKHAPAIIFIDELDALGRARGAYPFGGGHDEKEQTLNQLLAELDGFDPSKGLVLLAATNRPEILDTALLRAGRFDRQVLVDRPDKIGRVQILSIHLKKPKIASDVNAEAIAALTPGFTGADLANLVNEAALLATRRNAEAVAMDDFNQAIERIIAGLEKRNRLLIPKERETVAFHETGHALIALSLPGSDTVHKISIIPRGIGSLGYTIQRPAEEHFLMNREELENKIAVLLGGRAAEMLIFSRTSTGAADDLAKATDIAHAMVTRYGMCDAIGLTTYEQESSPYLIAPGTMHGGERHYSEDTRRKIDDAVKTLLDKALDRATAILTSRKVLLVDLAKHLLEQETLDEHDIERILAQQHCAAAQ